MKFSMNWSSSELFEESAPLSLGVVLHCKKGDHSTQVACGYEVWIIEWKSCCIGILGACLQYSKCFSGFLW